MTLSDLVAAIDSQRQHGNLSSAIRLFVLDFYRAQLSDAEEGHNEAQQTMARTARAYSLKSTARPTAPKLGRLG